MIQEDDVFYIGHITKFRGVVGEVEMNCTDDTFDSGTSEYFVCNMDGILVPFFWEEYRFKNSTTAIVKFEHIDNEQQAKQLVGAAVYYPKAAMPDELRDVPTSWQHFIGYNVFDALKKCVGQVEHVDERSENILMTIIDCQGKEVLIPIHPDLVLDYNIKERILVIDIPEGLLTLN